MKRNPFIAGLLSSLVPGLGQIYGGEGNRGGAIIAAAIGIGNLNAIILPLIAIANPITPKGPPNQRTIWSYWIPRAVHDVMSFWSVVFWIWAVLDAVAATRKNGGPDCPTSVR